MNQQIAIAGMLVGLWAFAGCGAGKSEALVDADFGGHPVPDAQFGVETLPFFDAAVISAWPSGKYITVDEVYAHLTAADPSMQLINVVDAQYYNLGFIAGSLKIPWDSLAGRLGELDPSRNIVLYCRKGVRSESAYTTLMEKSFPHVWVMEGGIERWIAAGYPTVAQ
jgi:rhodanese-related sulfurtransferase